MKKFLATILSVVLLLTIIPMAYAEENNTYKVGDIVQFGSYPQSEVKDEALIAELNALAPEWDEWTSYGYYSGNGESTVGKMIKGDWMRYIDVICKGKKYRGVRFLQYRPHYTYYESDIDNSYQNENGYFSNSSYWFEYEPIDWKILDPDKGLIMSVSVIDSQPYNDTVFALFGDLGSFVFYNDSSFTNYANNYEKSTIRKWLNEEFYNTAFTEIERESISVEALDNNGIGTSIGEIGYEEFDCNPTNDKVFLLSYKDVKNESYGFNNELVDDARKVKSSQYANSQGLYVYPQGVHGEPSWILRSAGHNSTACCGVTNNGELTLCGVGYSSFGIRPALHLSNLNIVSVLKCDHVFDLKKIVYPTCTTQGYTTYTCACGDTFVADYVNALGHKDNNGDYKCDNGCGYEYERPAPEKPDTPEDPSKDCSCNCHKGGIMGFFWKIINFFNKLFKSKQYCGCGAKHW